MANRRDKQFPFEDDPCWYKDAIVYELHVRAFFDSDGDGMGDFAGLTQKLDYLQDLGVTALWLLPFYPSPLRDDGYDISDYIGINPAYGSLRDFNTFIREAHQRGLRVIIELVLNHTSDQHIWFQRARKAKRGSRWNNFYVWSDAPDRYKDARIIFKDFESSNWSWDPVAKTYYWHRFYWHQPDLNYESRSVRRAILRVADFWSEIGVDGFRVDAVPYLYEREGTNCENLPETHKFLKELRRHMDQKFSNLLLLAEANQWPEDAMAYFGEGDECHMAFNFPIMPRMFMALRMEDRYPIVDILEQTPAIPDVCQWALFLRNHDELTLEMVTDEERDYMYRTYAHDRQARINLGIRRRLAPLMGNNRRRIELMNCLLFSLPGTPVIYYGDEIGMGDNIYLGDRNSVRTPMQWSADRNAGFSRANPQRLCLPVTIDPEYHYEAINVEAQQNNSSSLLWWMKRLIALRRRFKAFSRGTLEFLYPDNRKVLAFLRRYDDECVLVVANLSRFVQCVDLDLSQFKGRVPIELFGHTEFPPVGDSPYFLTLGPRGFYWIAMEPQSSAQAPITVEVAPEQVPALTVAVRWDRVLRGRAKAALEGVLPDYIRARRWFGGKARRIVSIEIGEVVPVPYDSCAAYIAMAQISYRDEEAETYVLPLAFATAEKAYELVSRLPHAVVAKLYVKDTGEEGVLYDASVEKGFCQALLDAIGHRRRFRGVFGELRALPTTQYRRILREGGPPGEPSLMKVEQSNTSVLYGDRLVLKLFRRVEEGINPDLEIGRYLTDRGFAHIPPVVGALEYSQVRADPLTVGILQGFVPNQGDAWKYTLDILRRYFEHVLARTSELKDVSLPSASLATLAEEAIPVSASDTIGPYLELAKLLGRRTAELHVVLGAASDDPDFSPEPFSLLYQRSLYQSMRNLTIQVFQLLRSRLRYLPEGVREEARTVLDLETDVIKRFRSLLGRQMTSLRIRCHGDYHLGQVLHTGRDFVIIDFEGEPARSLTERRLKRSPLRDVAGMLRSFRYAAYFDLLSQQATGIIRHEDFDFLETWARFWHTWVSVAFLKGYLEAGARGTFLPQCPEELEVLLDAYLLEKSIYETAYEINNRPDWLKIPLQGVLELVQPRAAKD